MSRKQQTSRTNPQEEKEVEGGDDWLCMKCGKAYPDLPALKTHQCLQMTACKWCDKMTLNGDLQNVGGSMLCQSCAKKLTRAISEPDYVSSECVRWKCDQEEATDHVHCCKCGNPVDTRAESEDPQNAQFQLICAANMEPATEEDLRLCYDCTLQLKSVVIAWCKQ